MKYAIGILIGVVAANASCGPPEHAFAPDVIVVERYLPQALRQVLEATIEAELCAEVEERGFDCRVPEQIDSLTFVWSHDERGSVNYSLSYCLKADCPEVSE